MNLPFGGNLVSARRVLGRLGVCVAQGNLNQLGNLKTAEPPKPARALRLTWRQLKQTAKYFVFVASRPEPDSAQDAANLISN